MAIIGDSKQKPKGGLTPLKVTPKEFKVDLPEYIRLKLILLKEREESKR